MALDSDAALVITQAQNMLSGVKQMFPTVSPKEGPETMRLNSENAIAEVLWLLGRKIPRLARAGRVPEAKSKLVFAQGMLFGQGAISRHDLYLITDYMPVSVPRVRHTASVQPEVRLMDAKARVYYAQLWLQKVWKDPENFAQAEREMLDAATLVNDRRAQEAFVRACDEYVRLGVMWDRDRDRYLQQPDID